MFLIRADGNAKIGAGHLMRCLTIAEALREALEEALFVCADKDSAALVEAHGFRAGVLGTDYRYMEAELPKWEQVIFDGGTELCPPGSEPQKKTHVILVDSYYATPAYLERLKAYGVVVLLDVM